MNERISQRGTAARHPAPRARTPLALALACALCLTSTAMAQSSSTAPTTAGSARPAAVATRGVDASAID
ncbi:hypothetical protein, partial [Pseudoxanthomonas sp. X-1]|uniref:hypothetical protein n=1 Tax=Pseudoxanthomonas sp. X-1 TaxID=2571115 RepID=UPI00110B1E13